MGDAGFGGGEKTEEPSGLTRTVPLLFDLPALQLAFIALPGAASIGIHGPGECFGEPALLDGAPRSAGAVAMETLVAYSLGREVVLDLAEAHRKLAHRVLERFSERLRHLTVRMESLTFLDIYGRVASCLLDFAAHHGQVTDVGVVLQMHLTQAELASCVAATRESVNKVLGVFRDEGLIRHDGHVMMIIDTLGLKREISYSTRIDKQRWFAT